MNVKNAQSQICVKLPLVATTLQLSAGIDETFRVVMSADSDLIHLGLGDLATRGDIDGGQVIVQMGDAAV